jgi:hypothetical protein
MLHGRLSMFLLLCRYNGKNIYCFNVIIISSCSCISGSGSGSTNYIRPLSNKEFILINAAVIYKW